MPTVWWLRPLSSAARVGEQSAVVWKRLNFSPPAARRSAFGVAHGPPNALEAPNPTSSSSTTSTLGAPAGGRSSSIGGKTCPGPWRRRSPARDGGKGRDGQHLAVRPIVLLLVPSAFLSESRAGGQPASTSPRGHLSRPQWQGGLDVAVTPLSGDGEDPAVVPHPIPVTPPAAKPANARGAAMSDRCIARRTRSRRLPRRRVPGRSEQLHRRDGGRSCSRSSTPGPSA